eukprot:2344693-Pyramimonas_sp.AAC.1
MHHSTVRKWEVKAGSCLKASSNQFHFSMESDLKDDREAIDMFMDDSNDELNAWFVSTGWSFHRSRCDATNSAAWQKCKLHGLELRSIY